MKRNRQNNYVYLLVLAVFLLLTMNLVRTNLFAAKINYATFEQYIQNGSISRIILKQNAKVPTGSLSIELLDGSTKTLYVSDVTRIEEFLKEKTVSYFLMDVESDNYFFSVGIPLAVAVVAMLIFVFVMNTRMTGGGTNKMMNFGKSRAKLNRNNNKVTFKQVAGLYEEKEDLWEIIDFLKNTPKYTKMGARIPKGVVLVGSPGTGKTLLAKAVAGEAGVPFFSISGSDFVEMFVGVGASRVRDLFEEAKRNAPCLIFIDEIDAVARRRGSGLGGGHDEREQTLNQLLVEMDGFEENQGIIVMAATNRVDILDPAILRPGRFDRKICVALPDVRGREEILKVHAKNKPLAEDVNLETLSRTTAGFSGADLENLMNEAALMSVKNERAYIMQEDIEKAFVKVGIGTEKKSKVVSEEEKRITAYHEAGHAILFHVLPHVGPVHTISIIPTGMGAAGYTMPLPEKDELFYTKGKMLEDIMVSLGGRIAEEIIFDDITTGAAQDIKHATQVARAMVTKYGMSLDVGMINYSGEDEVFIGRDFAQARNFSESMAAVIDKEVGSIISDCYERAKALIIENQAVLDRCAKILLEKEKIDRQEFESLFDQQDSSPVDLSKDV
ncbi:ATP-dependent zinc metalloprotease FtsH [Clostridia bacterium]|nr:ATP-dependent zinc metalloprotease FtsH [Clostridia bacterium]